MHFSGVRKERMHSFSLLKGCGIPRETISNEVMPIKKETGGN